jgi:signal peptidase I
VVEEKSTRPGTFWRELPILLGVAIIVAILVRTFALQTFYIPSESMQHTLEINDRVLVNKLVYHFRAPDRGEIVVFQAPAAWRAAPEEDDFIKRVIAVGGDTLACCDSQDRLMINGEPLQEPYLFTDGNGATDPAAPVEFEMVVPESRLWVLGDHRSFSGDSMDHYRSSGGDLTLATISEDDVIGRAFVRFWPVGRAGWLSVPETFDAIPDAQQGHSALPRPDRVSAPPGPDRVSALPSADRLSVAPAAAADLS